MKIKGTQSGAIYQIDLKSETQIRKFIPADRVSNNQFGSSVSSTRQYALISALINNSSETVCFVFILTSLPAYSSEENIFSFSSENTCEYVLDAPIIICPENVVVNNEVTLTHISDVIVFGYYCSFTISYSFDITNGQLVTCIYKAHNQCGNLSYASN